MAMTNAERQAKWREKRNALAKQAEAGTKRPKAKVSLRNKLDNARVELRQLRKIGLDGGKDLLHNEGFQKHLKEYIEGLAEQGRKHNATMSVVAVASLTKQLEDLLVAHGLWAGSQYWRARQTREERRAQYWRARQTREERKARGSKPLR